MIQGMTLPSYGVIPHGPCRREQGREESVEPGQMLSLPGRRHITPTQTSLKNNKSLLPCSKAAVKTCQVPGVTEKPTERRVQPAVS